jgi:hypothetical protein
MCDDKTEVVFEESQALRQPWLWILILPASLLEICLFTYGLYKQLYLGEPWGNRPMSDLGLIIAALCVIGLAVGLPALLYAARLSVRIDGRHLQIRFAPFLRKTIPLEQIVSCEVLTYSPLRDYGGWGVRLSWSGKGWAYNVRGNRGVQLGLVGGKRLLVGSQRPEELLAAIVSESGGDGPAQSSL